MEQIFQIKESDFNNLISDLKKHITEEIKSIQKEKKVEKPISPKEAAAYFKIGLNAFYKRIENRDIPTELIHRNGGKVYLFLSELEEHVKSNKKK